MEQLKILEQKTDELLAEINSALEQAKNKDEMLKKQLSRAELEVNDIYHYIEMNSFSASDGYKTLMMLNGCLERRRAIKMEESIVRSTIMVIENGLNPDRIGVLIERQDLGNYKPRVLKELFEK